MSTRLDHLVVGARDLEDGVAYVKEKLGVVMPFGGKHLKMGTHNHLIRIGNNVFLEIIAIDPDQTDLDRPRWFGLDDPTIQTNLDKSPRLLSWVVNCNDINKTMRTASCSFGHPELINRGHLNWYFGLPADGRLIGGGFLPYLIQWIDIVHPSNFMADVGIRLLNIKIYHKYPSWLEKTLFSIEAHKLVKICSPPIDGKSFIKAQFDTPNGLRELVSL
ncbi:VOC family protein [Desulfotignum balticum]|uniref:VOC family protein n=1 Tax=Desulfotignum balticum TaxID=115781 RepID=UPI000462ADA4|nr:VOC family protein [Desulfotignum balticum]